MENALKRTIRDLLDDSPPRPRKKSNTYSIDDGDNETKSEEAIRSIQKKQTSELDTQTKHWLSRRGSSKTGLEDLFGYKKIKDEGESNSKVIYVDSKNEKKELVVSTLDYTVQDLINVKIKGVHKFVHSSKFQNVTNVGFIVDEDAFRSIENENKSKGYTDATQIREESVPLRMSWFHFKNGGNKHALLNVDVTPTFKITRNIEYQVDTAITLDSFDSIETMKGKLGTRRGISFNPLDYANPRTGKIENVPSPSDDIVGQIRDFFIICIVDYLTDSQYSTHAISMSTKMINSMYSDGSRREVLRMISDMDARKGVYNQFSSEFRNQALTLNGSQGVETPLTVGRIEVSVSRHGKKRSILFSVNSKDKNNKVYSRDRKLKICNALLSLCTAQENFRPAKHSVTVIYK